jgi:hypothetical protein
MTEPPSSPTTASPWSVSGDEAAELMRLHREQLRAFEDIPGEPEEGVRAEARQPAELTLDDLPEDLRRLVGEYERSRPGVRLTPLRYITIGGPGGPGGAAVAGAAELPDDGLVSFVVTQTIADAERVEVTSRIFVARAAAASGQAA